MTAIRLGLLGGFEVQGWDGESLNIGMRKAKALLAWLALHPGRPQSRDRLAGLLWANSTDAQARHSLRQALSVLRRSLPDPASVLLTDGDTVTLAADAVASDVAELHRYAGSDDPQELERAAALYRGDFLEGSGAPGGGFEDWMLQERSALRERATQVFARLVKYYSSQGAWEPALRAAVHLLALDPLRESVHRELMLIYKRLGRPAEALRQYRSCKALVHRELGVAPEAETIELYRCILSERGQSVTAEPYPDPGLESLQAPSRPEPIDERIELVGREAELRQLAAALDVCLEAAAGGALLVRGEAGIGKTSLSEAAVELAKARGFRIHKLRLPDFRSQADGAQTALLIRELLGLSEDADAAGIRAAANEVCTDPDASLFLLDALGIPLDVAEERFYRALDIRSRSQGLERALGLLLQASARIQPRLLVVEDIHWADPGVLGLLARLGGHAAAVTAMLILTTRTEGEPLDPAWRGAMQGAPLTTLDLGPLRPDVATELARHRGVTDDAWTRRCIDRSGGNPLFLVHLLDAGPDVADSVPSSVQALVEGQLDGLPPDRRRAAQAASVLGQSFSSGDLGALLGPGLDPSQILSETRLVRRNGDRLSFSHVLVRDGIYQSIADPARRAWHRRAADWYRERDPLLYAEHLERAGEPGAVSAWLAAARKCRDSHGYGEALDLGERAWQLSIASEERAEAGLFFGELQREMGGITTACRVLESVISECADEQICCDARIELAAALLVQDDYGQASDALDAAAATAEALGDHERLARLHYHRGNALFPLGRLDDCMAAHSQALEHARAAGDPELEARALSGLADAFYQRGRMVTAHHYYDRCVRLCEANDLLRVQAPNLAGRAMTALYLNRLAEAHADSKTAVRLAALTRSQRDECLAHNILGLVATYGGDFEQAESEADAGLALSRGIGSRRFEADHLCTRGVARSARGNPESGLADLQAACDLIRGPDLAYGGPWMLGYLAQIADTPDLRRAALEEGEAALSADSVSHNHLQFRQCALEIALQTRDWDALEHQARELECYTADEPLPWSDLHIARARALMDWYRGDRGQALAKRLRSLEAEARQAGLNPAAEALAAALVSADGPGG
ncbi:MAG: AAA family ATPase [Chromatiaceae bacterium]|nr:AAA family ATPase [Chromatiaceae bacterium]